MAFDNIKLEKGLYTTGKSFTAALEELDPSENYEGTALGGLDAYERQLKRFDIKVSGSKSDSVSKFFSTTDSAALFPEYVARAVKTGIESNCIVDKIVATTTEIDSLDYRSIKTEMSGNDISLVAADEGSMLSEVAIKLSDKLTTLKKHGKMLTASYEAIKFQKLDLFTTVLRQIGAHIARQEFVQAVASIDFNRTKIIRAESDIFTYKDLINLWTQFEPYNMTSLIVSRTVLAQIMTIPEFKDSDFSLDFNSTGRVITPFGAEIFVLDDINDDSIVLALDKNFALEKVQAGGVLTEFDKLIDRQLERAAISTITGFSTIYDDAIVALAGENA